MRNVLLTSLFLTLLGLTAQINPVTINGKKFYQNGEAYHPMVMNMRAFVVLKDGTYYFADDFTYHEIHGWEWGNKTERDNETLADFNAISSLGFNTARITNLEPKYNETDGLYLECRDYYWNMKPDPILKINPNDPDDFGMNFWMDMMGDLLALASEVDNGNFKLIFLLGLHGDLQGPEFVAYSDFLFEIADRLPGIQYNELLLGIDLINEPCYFATSPSKQVLCSKMSTLYDLCKFINPNLLLTIGTCGKQDVFVFDPGLIKVDFFSLHRYPHFHHFEDKSDPLVQERIKNRLLAEMHWFNMKTSRPWIIGEIGFTACADYGINEGLHGSLTDLDNFMQTVLEGCFACGGAGFSWWEFQDGSNWPPPPDPSFPGNFFGLYERRQIPGPDAEKMPVVQTLKDFNIINANITCGEDFSNYYDKNRLYYNPLEIQDETNAIEGYLRDQNNTPIVGAVIQVGCIIDEDIDNLLYYYTYSDGNGYFKALAPPLKNDPPPPPNLQPRIQKISVSSFGTAVYNNQGNPLIIPSSIVLTRIPTELTIDNKIYVSGQSYLESNESIVIKNTQIETSCNVTFTASKSIEITSLNTEFGSNASFFIAPNAVDCNSIPF